jgi:molybdopterin converting factor small subunit
MTFVKLNNTEAALNYSAPAGHNAKGVTIRVQVRLFNTLARFTKNPAFREDVVVAADATVGDLIERFKLPVAGIFLVLRNGRDITPGIYQGGVVNTDAGLSDGDVIAFSGPVPYSYGYGAPVV